MNHAGEHRQPVVGLALGSGSARGWAHIGVIQELEAMGIRPGVVAGTSVGAIVGAAYVSGQLERFAEWVESLTLRDVFSLMDISLSGGVVKGEKLLQFFSDEHDGRNIEDFDCKFVSVCTEMESGREVWITKGSPLEAARASCALPGLLPPAKVDGRWMLDGGLVNPVPVSACRAMGADVVIAVNLNAQLMGRHLTRASGSDVEREAASSEERSIWHKLMDYFTAEDGEDPTMFDVIATSINIMQDRITRSRMAGDPPEVTLVPQLEDFAIMDFHRAYEAISQGRKLVREHAEDIRGWLGSELADRV